MTTGVEKLTRITAIQSRRQFLAGSLAAAVAAGSRRAAAIDSDDRADVAWLAAVQRPPAKRPTDTPRLSPLLQDANGQPITTLDAWKRRREAIRSWWLEFLGYEKLDRPDRVQLEVISEDRPPGVVRQLVRYEVEPGMATEAYLLRPAEGGGRRAGVVVLHSTVAHSIRQPAGVEGRAEKAFGLKLAQRGCVTVCPRNYLWPTNTKIAAQAEAKRFHQRHPGVKGMAKMLLDAVVALDILAAQEDVDPKRLGAVGHSLGAKEVLYLAAFDQRVQVTISSEGGIGTRFSNWDAPWYLGESIRGEQFRHEHHELLALIAPRPFLLLGGDSADGDRSWPFIDAALPAYRLYDGTPRLGLLNHRQGHSVPPDAERKIYEWFEAYL